MQSTQEIKDALMPIYEDVKARYGHAYEELDWNPDYEFSLNLRVSEFRRILNMLDGLDAEDGTC